MPLLAAIAAVSTPALTQVALDVPPAEIQEPNEWRSYDLVGIQSLWYEIPEEGPVLFPNLTSGIGDSWDSVFDEYEGSQHGGHLAAELLMELYGPEFEYEGRRLELIEGARMVVVGPPSLQQRVVELIGFLESTFAARAEVQVDLVSLPAGADAPTSSLLSPAEADEWLAGVAAGGQHQQFVRGVGGEGSTVLDLRSYRRVVLDYDVEIAQGAAIGDPIICTIPTGTRLELLGQPGTGGLFLSGVWQQAGALDVQRNEIQLAFRAGSENGGLHTVRDTSSIQGYELPVGAVVWNGFLPDDRVVTVSAGRADGGQDVLLLRRVGGDFKQQQSLVLNERGAKLVALNLGHTRPSCYGANGWSLEPGAWPPGGNFWYQTNEALSARHIGFDHSMLEERIGWDLEASALQRIGNWMLLYPSAEAVASGDMEGPDEIELRLQSLAGLGSSTSQLEVRTSLEREGLPPLRSSTVCREGSGAVLLAGSEQSIVVDYDVEVAQFAAVPDPRVDVQLDGMALYVRPKLGANGTMSVELRGMTTRAGEREQLNPGSPLYGYMDQGSMTQLPVFERRILQPSGDGSWTLVTGDVGGSHTLTVTVRAL